MSINNTRFTDQEVLNKIVRDPEAGADSEQRTVAVNVVGGSGGTVTANQGTAGATWPVSVASLPLPSGAATEVTLASIKDTAGIKKITDALPTGSNTIGKVDQGAGGASAWKVDGSAVTQPVSATSLPLPTGASTEATLLLIKAKTDNLDVALSTRTKPADEQKTIEQNVLVPAKYDYISLSYTGANLTGVVYKTGGSGGSTVATLTLAYTGAVLNTVTKT